MKQIKSTLRDKALMRYSIFIAFTGALLYILYFTIKNFDTVFSATGSVISSILNVLSPLFIGLILAYLISPIVTFIQSKVMSRIIRFPKHPEKEKKRLNTQRILSVLTTYLLLITAIATIIYGFTALILGEFVFESITKLSQTIMNTFASYESTIQSWGSNLPSGILSDKIYGVADSFMNWVANSLSSGKIVDTVAGIGGSIANFVIGIVISIYLVKDKDFFIRSWNKLLYLIFPKRGMIAINGSLHEVNGVISQFVRGLMIDALIVAILSSVGLSIMGLKFSVFIGIFAGICNVIPYFGPVLGMIPAFIVGMFTEGFWHGAIAVLILFAVQQIDCNLIYPKVVGSSTGLHPLFVLLAVTIGGSYAGLVGMILAVPTAGVVQVFVRKWADKRALKISTNEENPSPS